MPAALLVVNTAVHSRPVIAGLLLTKLELLEQTSEVCARELQPGDTVQVFDTTMGGVHLLLSLDRRQPTRFLYDFTLLLHDPEHPTIRAMRAELLGDLQAHSPKLILVYEQGWMAEGYERLNRFPALIEWIRQEYVLLRELDGCRIFIRTHDESASAASDRGPDQLRDTSTSQPAAPAGRSPRSARI